MAASRSCMAGNAVAYDSRIAIALGFNMPGGEELAQGHGAAAEIKYIQSGIQLHIAAFTVPENKLNIGTDQEEWLEIFKEELQLQKVVDDGDKLTCLRRYGGKEIRRLVKHLPQPSDVVPEDTEFNKQ